MRDLVASVREELSDSPAVVDQVKRELQAALDHLEVQLALGKAEARDALDAQREKIAQALRRFEASADRTLTDAAFRSGRLWDDLVERASRLEAEFDAARHGWLDERGAQRQMVGPSSKSCCGACAPIGMISESNAKWFGRGPIRLKSICVTDWSRSRRRFGG